MLRRPSSSKSFTVQAKNFEPNFLEAKVFQDSNAYVTSEDLEMISSIVPKKLFSLHENEQLSLLLSCVLFLVDFWDFEAYPFPVCIVATMNYEYVFLLSKLFPSFTFFVYTQDDLINEGRGNSRIEVVDEKFTPELGMLYNTEYYKSKGLYFIFHIKINNDNKEEEEELMDQQQEYVLAMRPTYACLRFSIPVTSNYTSYTYFRGLLYWPLFVSKDCNDVFLVPDVIKGDVSKSNVIKSNVEDSFNEDTILNFIMIDWPLKQHKQVVSYHNQVTRTSLPFVFNNDEEDSYVSYDQANALFVLDKYKDKISSSNSKISRSTVNSIRKLVMLV
jgi:hypothetical protein